jgi:hypothetical protein
LGAQHIPGLPAILCATRAQRNGINGVEYSGLFRISTEFSELALGIVTSNLYNAHS